MDAPLKQIEERLVFDGKGGYYPCFLYTPSGYATYFFSIPSTADGQVGWAEEIKGDRSALNQGGFPAAAWAVVRGFGKAAKDDRVGKFTAFFISPHILVTTRHSLYVKGVPLSSFSFNELPHASSM